MIKIVQNANAPTFSLSVIVAAGRLNGTRTLKAINQARARKTVRVG
jgi:hypothetical protein